MLVQRLKEETLPLHKALESLLAMPATRLAYAERVKCFFGYIEPWERRVRSVLKEFPDVVNGRGKTDWLREDLSALGVSPEEMAALPRCEELPDLSSAARALGSFYVWEGSTLGGQIISRHLREELEIEPATGGRFFWSYGTEVGANWRRFLQELNGHSSSEADDAIVGGAMDTFETLQRWAEVTECDGARS
jgi:heme oxygenase